MARVLPNATVIFWFDAGVNPDGVDAIAAPASATAMKVEDNIIGTT